MNVMSEAPADRRLQGLREVYDRDLAPFLEAQDAQVRWARRVRWPILIIGVGLSGGGFAYMTTMEDPGEILLGIDFAVFLGSIFLFFVITASIADDIRHRMLKTICRFLGFTYEEKGAAFPRDRFAILGLADYNYTRLVDRVFGQADGVEFDLASGTLGNDTTDFNGKRHLHIHFDGLLMRFSDPAAPGVSFRLVPRTKHTNSQGGTGDDSFDTVFAIEADDISQARHALDAPTRAALLDIAGIVGGTTPSIGFAEGSIVLAFVTDRRFEIGKLRPPLADFARVEHLAEQVAIVFDIGSALRTRAKSM
jgi:hypothetical protein